MSNQATNNSGRCAQCAYFEQKMPSNVKITAELDAQKHGNCVRYAPHPVRVDVYEAFDRLAVFPIVRCDQRCGDFKQK